MKFKSLKLTILGTVRNCVAVKGTTETPTVAFNISTSSLPVKLLFVVEYKKPYSSTWGVSCSLPIAVIWWLKNTAVDVETVAL